MRTKLLFLGMLATLTGCADQATQQPPKTTAATSWCCLVDPDHGSLLMPDNKASRARLDSWVSRNADHLSITGGAKPRFILLHVGADFKIKDQMPLADQSSPKAPHKLTQAEVESLRTCFNGGRRVKINWPSKTVQPF